MPPAATIAKLPRNPSHAKVPVTAAATATAKR